MRHALISLLFLPAIAMAAPSFDLHEIQVDGNTVLPAV